MNELAKTSLDLDRPGRGQSVHRVTVEHHAQIGSRRGDDVAIKGVLFDTGDTLTRPIGGRWNPRFDFEVVLLRHVPDAPPTFP